MKNVELILRIGDKDIRMVTIHNEKAEGFNEERVVDLVMMWLSACGLAQATAFYMSHQHLKPSNMLRKITEECRKALSG